MAGRQTDHRNTDLWSLNLDVVRRRTGKILWQPRIGCWHEDKVFRNEALPGRFAGLDMAGIYRELGVSNRVYQYSRCFRQVLDPRVSMRTVEHSPMMSEEIMLTPRGRLNLIQMRNTSNPGRYPKKWWITCAEEMDIHRWVLETSTWEWDQDAYDRIRKEWGFAGAPNMWMPRTTLLSLLYNTMGTEEGIFALYDYPETVEKYFTALNENHDRLIDVVLSSPVEIVNFGDNIHSSVVTPQLFRQYVMPAYLHRNQRLHSAGKFTTSHWDGNVRQLLPFARSCGLDGIEAVTPLPQGDVTLSEVKEAFGDSLFLMDGLAALLFDPSLYPLEDLTAQTRECIDLFAGQLILGVSDEIPSRGDLERVEAVTRIVDDYNASILPYCCADVWRSERKDKPWKS